jgi:hypothetical protein
MNPTHTPPHYWRVEVYDKTQKSFLPISSYTQKGEVGYDPTVELTKEQANELHAQLTKAHLYELFYLAKVKKQLT